MLFLPPRIGRLARLVIECARVVDIVLEHFRYVCSADL